MDGYVLTIWVVRLLFLFLLYVFLFGVARTLIRDLRQAALDPITSLGRDVNNAIVVDDQFASAQHAVLTFRGRTWYVEDLKSTNGTFVNGSQVEGVSPLGYGDEVQVGQVRMRLERPRR
jgi:predicted component of type VI protein secretion system